MKLAIIGTRTFTDYNRLEQTLLELYPANQITQIISGGAQGTDALAERFAQQYHLPITIHEAQWSRYGRSAGPIRNQLIVNEADHVIAFWDGHSPGTRCTIELAQKANKPVEIIHI